MSERTGWDRRLSVAADGKGLVGHAGAVLLHKIADRVGLTEALGGLWPDGQSATWRDRAHVLVSLAAAIVCGARSLLEAERLQAHQAALFGVAPSDSTTRRALASLDEPMLARIAKARARVRGQVWQLLHLRPGGFPWLKVAGKRLLGWIVIDIDATIITSVSDKHGAAVTFKKTYGFHPLACWCANTQESLAMLLREGNAGSNTVADHLRVLSEALAQIPNSCRAKILVRVDGAGATHDLLTHLEGLNTTRRTVRYLVGWTITTLDEQAIARLPATAWADSLDQNGGLQQGYHVAELTGLNQRNGWPEGMRLLVRRVRPSARHRKNLTAFETRTGWKYSIIATNIGRMWGIAGSHHPQWLDALARAHAVVEDRVRAGKAMGLRNLPSQDWTVNQGWIVAANLGHDLDCWVRLLALHDQDGLERAEPDTMRYRLYHLPARLSAHARRRYLRIERTWPWAQAFVLAWQRLTDLPALA
ncbi:DDE family transposase [Nonomuraea polychroma]|uniref:DDE family transposase n=1 Tax=Nonomuraea polychroma TaxID=46176 RepID=A0A438LXA9_9ACTN|nr:IS1380 family transposase [Nonomuraea polychroma]RVX37918.1 DDE family transposase [Nonomuraea polychroma]RVX41363.1 DDE family transposase [Nonomuraea polychroma]